jgi:hypothetical protein
MNTLEAALIYIGRFRWRVIPVPYRKKGPEIPDWPNLQVSEADAPRYFNGGQQNIGVVLGPCSNNLCDVDLDCDEAIAAAVLLPGTLTFGRTSTPTAHRLYQLRSKPTGKATVAAFKDPMRANTKDAMLLEARLGFDKAAQTIFPPSTHEETGEAISWQNGVEPPTMLEGDELLGRCAGAAAAALLIRYWPAKGNRHELSLALGGAFARAGWDIAAIDRFVSVVVQAARDPRPADRVRCARDAADKVAAGEPAYGFPKLKEILGDAVAGKLAEWLGLRGNVHHGPVIRVTTDLTATAEAAERAIVGAGLAGVPARIVARAPANPRCPHLRRRSRQDRGIDLDPDDNDARLHGAGGELRTVRCPRQGVDTLQAADRCCGVRSWPIGTLAVSRNSRRPGCTLDASRWFDPERARI